jgi:hypothetical protein
VLDVNGQSLIQDLSTGQGIPAPSAERGTITLSAGQWYPFVIYYSQLWGGAGIQFEWQQPATTQDPNPTFQVIPSADLWNLSPSYTNPNSQAIVGTGSYPWEFPLGTGGTETIYAQVMDLDGSVSSTFTASILELINATPPIIHMTLNGGQSTTTSTTIPVSLSIQGSGFTAGQGQIQFQVDGGSWSVLEPYTASTTVTIPNTPGTHTVTVQATDANGLQSQASGQITLVSSQTNSQTGASGSVLSVANSQGITLSGQTVQVVQGGQVQLNFSPPSGTGGAPTSVMATSNGTAWRPWLPYAASMPITLSLGEVNTVGAQFKYVDNSLSQIYLLSVLPLIQAPTVQASWQGGATATTTGSMTATISVSDSALPATNLQYSVNGGSSWAAVPSATFTAAVSLPASGSNTVVVEVRDPAGDTSSVSLTAWSL